MSVDEDGCIGDRLKPWFLYPETDFEMPLGHVGIVADEIAFDLSADDDVLLPNDGV